MCSGSGETWGLAVNEAMNFALPIVVSDTCGCSYDLVTNGENGFIVPEGDISQLMARIDSALDDSFKLLAGLSSQERVKSYSISNIIANIRQVD
jgi:glycosyltransferase involved in cell wall biosynthesis